MRSRRDSILVLCIVLIAAILAGCGAAEQRPALDRIEYTNLNDSGSRELLKELLSEIGVSDERVQGFFRRVDHFHDSVKQEWLTDVAVNRNTRLSAPAFVLIVGCYS